jgi:hypothetical protein
MPPPLPSRPPERPNANVRAVLHLVFVLGLPAFVLFMSRGWEDADFLKNRERYTKVGARIPKGVLLEGC